MKKLLFFIFIITFNFANAQMWGLYTLYSVKGTSIAYLIDTNSVVYKKWTFPATSKTCFSSFLIPGDTLVRAVNYPGNIISGGPISGEVQKVDWNNNIVWDFVYSDSTHVLHHDICPMPNGNVLMIALDVKTAAELIQAGSGDSTIRHADKIMEVHPTGSNTGTIVWEWDVWDHFCQVHDATKDNYVTSILDNPQLLNINYNNALDLVHINGIDYNVALDQIAFSSFSFSEVFVIDHSTTTAEAASHTGGNSGHGGDIIYRWGNPAAFDAAGAANFNVVHDAHWIPSDNPYYPNYLCGFNNNGGADGFSCVDIFNPPYNGYNYSYTPGAAYAPDTYIWRYTANATCQSEGSSQQLPNGNSLICLTINDSIFEVNNSGTMLWCFKPSAHVSNAVRYTKCYVRGPKASANASSTEVAGGIPVTLSSIATTITENNPTYTYSWSSIPTGFNSSQQNPVLSPTSTAKYIVTITDSATACSDTASVIISVNTDGINNKIIHKELTVFPNPTNGIVNISGNLLNTHSYEITVSNAYGITVKKQSNCPTIDFSGFAKGIYYLSIKTGNSVISNYKVIY